jgi:Tol biopolymer transport system component
MKEIDWTVLPADVPPHVRRLLRRCLEKDPKRRLQHIGDARIELEEPASRDDPAAATAAPARALKRSIGRRALPWVAGAVACALTALITWTIVRPAPTALRPAQRFPITLPATIQITGGQPAISPDGTRIVFSALEGGKRQLYIRTLDQLEAQPIRGTEGGQNPFFSPDGEWIAFFTGPARASMLKKVPGRGGPPLSITDAIGANSGTWTPDGTIVFSRSSALYSIPSGGGTATKLTTPVPPKELRHAWPSVLPGGRHVLFSVAAPPDFEQSHVALLSLETGQYRTVIEQGYNARYVASGHIVYALAGNLMAVPFDLRRHETTGPAVLIVEGVHSRVNTGEAAFAVTSAGLLVFAPGTSDGGVHRTLVWVDRSGKEEALPLPAREYTYARLSPEGRRIALDIRDQDQDIWVWDIERRTLTRLTFDPNPDGSPVWTTDGKRIIFAQHTGELTNMAWQAADGSGQPERLTEGGRRQNPMAVTPDGTRLLFREVNAEASETSICYRWSALDAQCRSSRHASKREIPRYRRTGDGSPTSRTNPVDGTTSTCGRSQTWTPGGGRCPQAAGWIRCGRATAASCSSPRPGRRGRV